MRSIFVNHAFLYLLNLQTRRVPRNSKYCLLILGISHIYDVILVLDGRAI